MNGQWESRRIRREPRKAFIHLPLATICQATQARKDTLQYLIRPKRPTVPLAGIANCAVRCPIGALLHPPKPLWM